MTDVTDEQMAAAIERIAMTGDGLLLYRWLQGKVLYVPDALDLGALPVLHGERRLATVLMSHMAKGIEESAGRSGNPADQPVVHVRRKPVDTRAGPRGVGSRVPVTEPGPEG